METKRTRFKGKNNKKQTAKPKNSKKPICNDGPTCSMFLNDLTKKFMAKKKLEEEEKEPIKIVETIIESITNALPFKFSKKSASLIKTPPQAETDPKSTDSHVIFKNKSDNSMDVDPRLASEVIEKEISLNSVTAPNLKLPRMPVLNSDILKIRPQAVTVDASVNTTAEHDVAGEITRHVLTLKKISLIAEDFNQKTAKNLKEIVDSVQEDLIKKLEEVKQAKIDAALANSSRVEFQDNLVISAENK